MSRLRSALGLVAAFAAGGLVAMAATSGGVTAQFEQVATADVSVGVGAFSCSMTATSTDATVTPTVGGVQIDFAPQDGSQSGAATVTIDLTNTGTMPLTATWQQLRTYGPGKDLIHAELAVSSPHNLDNHGDTQTATLAFTWNAMTGGPYRLNTVVTAICTDSAPSPLRGQSRAFARSPQGTGGFQQILSAAAAVTVEPGDNQCNANYRDSDGVCHEAPQCTVEQLASADHCPAIITCDVGEPDANGNCPPEQITCTEGQVLEGDQCVTPDPPAPCEEGKTLIDGECVVPQPDPECAVDEELVNGTCEPAQDLEVDCDSVPTPDDPACTDPENGEMP